ncbi:MAG: addiction module protein [Methylophilaceae bacterium]|jgi:putative addiction module component (TIGR02574 family)
MNPQSQAVIEQANQLTALEKLEVVDALLASVDKPDAEIDRLWANEAEERLAAYRRGEIKALELNEVLAKYRKT